MNYSHQLSARIRELCETIAGTCMQLKEHSHPTAAHQLRVSIKELRALFPLADDKDFPRKKYIRLLRLLQFAAGTGRDALLQVKLLRKYEKNMQLRFEALYIPLQMKQQLGLQQQTVIIRNAPLQLLQQLPHERDPSATDISRETLLSLSEAEYRAIRILPSNAGHEAWHDLRKRVKRLYYQQTFIYGDQKRRPPVLSFIKKAGTLLGNWHDHQQFLLFIKENSRKGKDVETDLLLKSVRERTQELLAECSAHLRQQPVWGQSAW